MKRVTRQKLLELQEELKRKVAELADNRVVAYPASYPYLLQEMGLLEAARGSCTTARSLRPRGSWSSSISCERRESR